MLVAWLCGWALCPCGSSTEQSTVHRSEQEKPLKQTKNCVCVCLFAVKTKSMRFSLEQDSLKRYC